MKLYKNGHEIYAEKDQVELLIEDGWSKVKPSKKAAKPEPEETEDEIMDDEEVIEDDESEEETEDGGESSEPQAAPKKIGKKAIAKKK